MTSTALRVFEDDNHHQGSDGPEGRQEGADRIETDAHADQTFSFDGYTVRVGTTGNDVVDGDNRGDSV